MPSQFEGAICIHGKLFHKVAKAVETKTCSEVIEFYYVWKKTGHYKQWKTMYKSEMAILAGEESDSDDGSETNS